jgi:hypothetical protein
MQHFIHIHITFSDIFLQHRMNRVLVIQAELLILFVSLGQNIIWVLFQSSVVLSDNFSLLEVNVFRIVEKLNATAFLLGLSLELLDKKEDLPTWRQMGMR